MHELAVFLLQGRRLQKLLQELDLDQAHVLEVDLNVAVLMLCSGNIVRILRFGTVELLELGPLREKAQNLSELVVHLLDLLEQPQFLLLLLVKLLSGPVLLYALLHIVVEAAASVLRNLTEVELEALFLLLALQVAENNAGDAAALRLR